MLKLGVNIDHVATLREARYRGRTVGEPDPTAAALQSEAAGAHGITAHLREDRRHLQDRDLHRLRESISTRLNLEMANTPAMRDIAIDVHPDYVCVVPERREEVTTEGGLAVVANEDSLADLRRALNSSGIEVSLFIAPDLAEVEAASRVGAQYIELHTGSFAEAFGNPEALAHEVKRLVDASNLAHERGIRVNAGHGLTVGNVSALFAVPHLEELNIGHHIISRSITIGLTAAVQEMLAAMKGYPESH